MVNVSKQKCTHPKCKEIPIFGYKNQRPQSCETHKADGMIHLAESQQCCVPDCMAVYMYIHENQQYCSAHCPVDYETILKRHCKYCDLKETTDFVCSDCRGRNHKKEWGVVQHLRRHIDTPFMYDSAQMLQGCTNRRPDLFFEMAVHCVIVEVDENQHRAYESSCECARISEIVGGIGGKSVVFIRYNPDTVRSKGRVKHVPNVERVDVLVQTVKDELTKAHDRFCVQIVQVWYDDLYETYLPVKREDITDRVAV
jgi:hypothetical protein